MPSMPVGFWNDPGGERYRGSYFDVYPGVWRHGDWVTMSPRRSFVISGRSDATLNRGGVRLGTAEFYAVVEELPEVTDSLVVHLEDRAGRARFVAAVRRDDSRDHPRRPSARPDPRRAAPRAVPRHVPDAIEQVPAIPRTMTGKKLEKPIKQILLGRPASEVISADAVTGFDAVAAFRAPARPS